MNNTTNRDEDVACNYLRLLSLYFERLQNGEPFIGEYPSLMVVLSEYREEVTRPLLEALRIVEKALKERYASDDQARRCRGQVRHAVSAAIKAATNESLE